TVGISAVGPVSFDGDVRELTPVPMSAQIDLLSELELPELPVGPDFPSPGRRAATLALSAPVPAPTPLSNFRGVGRFDLVTGGQAGSGSPPDTNGDVGLA